MAKENANKRFWDKVAKLYTFIHERKNAKLYRALCVVLAKSLDKKMHVLELACGSGQLTFPLCAKVSSWEATDFSEKMIEAARARAADLPVSFAVQDATNLSYADGVFDAVVIANALHIMPNPDKALAEIRRVLKTGGLLLAPTFVYDGNVNKTRLWLMERIGFRTFHKWTSKEYIEFVRERGFDILDCSVIVGEMLPECVLICSARCATKTE